MIESEVLSRPARLGRRVTGLAEETVTRLFTRKRVLVRLEPSFHDVADARETFLFTINQILRFCPNLSVCLGKQSRDLVSACEQWATQIHGPTAKVDLISEVRGRAFDAVVNVGREVFTELPGATVNSSGWVARLATSNAGIQHLHWSRGQQNVIGALGAACRAAGAVFLTLLNNQRAVSNEISLFAHELGEIGNLPVGPLLPDSAVQLDAFLVGCGSVTNGWAYVVKRLPITGSLQAIDRQSLRKQNLGSYVSVGLSSVGKSKALCIKELLKPRISVTDRQDQWEFFRVWLRYGLPIPPLVIAGLDNVRTRHSVQRLWPETLIDMAAGGLESQVIVKHRRSNGQCLLNALEVPPNEIPWAQSLANATGLSAELIESDPTGEITPAEVHAPHASQRLDLQAAVGQLRCGYVNRHTLEMEHLDSDFEPAAPFVTSYSGVVAAAETMKWLMGFRHEDSLHYQMSFRSGLDRALQMKCNPACECQVAARSAKN